VLSYSLGKGIAFAAALALPRLVDVQTYGVLELAMTIGTFGTSLLGLGVPGAAARAHLVDNDPQAAKMLAAFCLWLAFAGLLLTALMIADGQGPDHVVCTAILGLYGFQFSMSTYTRMTGLIHVSGWFDNLAILVVAVIAAALLLIGHPTSSAFAWIFAGIALAAAAASAFRLVGVPPGELAALARRGIKVGAPMMLYSFANMAIFGTARIVIAKYLSLSDVASFSLCSRVALILIFLNQLLATGFFKQLYQMDYARLSRIMAAWMVVLSSIAFAFAAIGHYAGEWLVIGTSVPVSAVLPILPAVIMQTALLVFNSNLEIFVNRELISHRAAMVMGPLIAVAAAAVVAIHLVGAMSLMAVIHVYTALMIGSVVSQMMLLGREGFSFKLCYALLPLTAAPLLVSLLP
jgi:O-antigen/teichoic acid export membrane protein